MRKNQKASLIATSIIISVIVIIVMGIVAPKITLYIFFGIAMLAMSIVVVAFLAFLWILIYDTFEDPSEEPNKVYQFFKKIFL